MLRCIKHMGMDIGDLQCMCLKGHCAYSHRHYCYVPYMIMQRHVAFSGITFKPEFNAGESQLADFTTCSSEAARRRSSMLCIPQAMAAAESTKAIRRHNLRHCQAQHECLAGTADDIAAARLSLYLQMILKKWLCTSKHRFVVVKKTLSY